MPLPSHPSQTPATDLATGLTHAEAAQRLAAVGANEIGSSRLKSRLIELAKIFLDPMGLMLLGLAALHAILGARGDAIILLIAWLPVTAVDVVLELRASVALKALQGLLSPVAKVLREGAVREVSIRDLVPGDLLLFEEGQTLPADGRVVEGEGLTVNESALTGESVPIEKDPGQVFFSGTQILLGRGVGQIEVTGRQTRLGKITETLQDVQGTASPLKRKVDRLVRVVLLAAVVLAAVLLAVELVRTHDLVQSLIVALTFGMSAVPEEFPLVFALYLSLGAWRLARRKVLVKSLPSVEALGSADVLCTDKTGTLTEGRFQLTELRGLRATDRTTWEAALMACEPRPVDAMEVAIHAMGSAHLDALKAWSLVWDYPFEKQGKHMTHVWRRADSSVCRIAMKGSVEGVLEHCRVTPEERAQIDDLVKQYASQGRRLLGLAMREGTGTGVRATDEQDLEFLAVLVFSDPIRPSVAQAIAACQAAGIEIKMVTGDHPFTARHVADEAGIRRAPDALFTGQELERMDAGQRRRAFLEGSLFSRVVPEQKLEMVRSLQESGRVVAMIGDGINDALALRLADIGISMGRSATDVARSAAQIVLMESDFSGIVATLMEGRRILSNLKRSFAYLVSFHVPVILLTLLPPFLGWPPLLMPLHIIALELVVHPVSALVFENLPMEAPRAAAKGESSAGLIGRSSLVASLAAGVLVSLGALTSYGLLTRSATVEVARSSAFAAVLAGNVAFAAAGVLPRLTLRFGVTSALLLGSVILIAIVPLAPLHLSPMSWGVTLGALGIGALGVLPGLVVSRRRA